MERTETKSPTMEAHPAHPNNPLQSDFVESSSMDSDEQYLVRKRPSRGP